MKGQVITDIENLKTWFFTQNKPYWSVRAGQFLGRASGTSTKPHLFSNDSIESMEESWELLEKMLLLYTSGLFTIYVKSKPGADSSGMRAFFQNVSSQSSPSIAGINASHPMYNPNFVTVADMEKKIQDALANKEKDDTIASLEYQLEQQQGIAGRVVDKLMDHPQLPQLAEVLIVRLLSLIPAAPQQNPMPVQNEIPVPINGGPDQEKTENSLVHQLNRIRVYFPDLELFLDKLADWIEHNPDMAMTLFNQQTKT